ncbi:ATP-binding protein [Roseovarius sp. D22-M7]|uniref:ATP-binding protein n=1 Tax=Roseovarius sp. D22-M7 TaxID=3127116 RepID=UPI00300FAB86
MIRALRNLPLSLRLPLLGGAMMILVGAVASQQVLSELGRVQDARLQELARLHVEGLSIALGPLVLRRDVWEVYDTLTRAAELAEGQRMVLTAVADEDGRVLAATDPRRVPTGSPIAGMADTAVPLDQLSVGARARTVDVVAPLDYQGRRVGRIVSQLDVTDLQAERRRALWLLIAGNALAIAFLTGLGYAVMRRMLRPVSVLARQMAGAGDAPQPIPAAEMPHGEGDLARLARTYNGMVDSVAAKADTDRRLAERERFVALGRLSSSLAHEINNPLGGLLNATDTIRNFPDRPDIVRGAAALLERGLQHLRDVARVTLEQNRLDRQTSVLSQTDFEDIRLLIEPELKRMAQDLDWHVPDGVVEGLMLPAAPVRQILLNLLLNASAAAGQGGRVGLYASADEAGLSFAVFDNGPGLPDAARVRLLGNVTVTPAGGGGVGLRLVRDLVKGLGGSVTHARKDGMTRICVILPQAGGRSDA